MGKLGHNRVSRRREIKAHNNNGGEKKIRSETREKGPHQALLRGVTHSDMRKERSGGGKQKIKKREVKQWIAEGSCENTVIIKKQTKKTESARR